jgi:hypothetical protein
MRSEKPHGLKLFESSESASSSITYLNIIRDSEMIVSYMDGRVSSPVQNLELVLDTLIQLASYDMRFCRNSTPLLSFTGHVNEYTQKLVCILSR